MATVGSDAGGLWLPEELCSLVREPRFWSDFFWLTEPKDGTVYEALDEAVVRFNVGEERALELSFGGMGYFSLSIVGPEGSADIAWDDQAHWHPHVLRWDELDVICRAVAASEPNANEARYPGVSLLLLERFAPICSDEDAALALPLLHAAWQQVPRVKGRLLRKLLERDDRRGHHFVWRQADGRWLLEQNEDSPYALYTLRHGENAEFPWGPLDALVSAAAATVDRLGGPTRIALHPSPEPPRPRLEAELSVTTVQGGVARLPGSAGSHFGAQVDAALRDLGWGECTPSGSSSGGGEEISLQAITLEGEPERGLALAQAALLWARAPGDVFLRVNGSSLAVGDFSPAGVPLQLRAQRVRVSQLYMAGLIIHYEPQPLLETSATLERIAGSSIALDDDGYRIFELPDGGRLQLAMTGEPDAPDGFSCVILALSLESCRFLLDLSRLDELVLFPLLLTASETRAAALAEHWPGAALVTEASELLAILERGPGAWWEQRGPALLPQTSTGASSEERRPRKWWQFW